MNDEKGVFVQFFLPIDGEEGKEEIGAFVETFVEVANENGLNLSNTAIVDTSELEDFEIVEDEKVCSRCGGSDLIDEDESDRLISEEEWNDLYAPVAQKEEHFSPKEKVEGSNPSGSTSLKEETKV